jgi:hypothetical protein
MRQSPKPLEVLEMSASKPSVFIILLIAAMIAGCGGTDIKTGIVGEWKGETVKQDFHFYSDGRVELSDLQHSIYSGTYEITGSNTLTCTFESPIFTEPVVMKVDIKGDKLTMTADSGRKEVYVRK